MVKVVAFEKSLFLFQGRDTADNALFDLYRYDTTTATWTSLTPVGFDFPFDAASLQGSNLVLSRWGLIRYGGYVRQPYMASTFKHGQVSNL